MCLLNLYEYIISSLILIIQHTNPNSQTCLIISIMNQQVKCRKKLSFFTYLFPNWRIRSQILIIQLLFSSIVVLFIALSNHFSFQIVRQILITNHENILVNKYLARSTNNNLLHYKQLTRISLLQSDQQLWQVKNIYEFSLEENILVEFQPQQCLQKHPNDTILQNSTFCYGIFGSDETTVEQEKLKNLSKVLTFLILYLQSDIVQYVTTTNDQYFSYWPGNYFNKSYVPHSRLWYIGGIQPTDDKSIQYTQPYLSQVGRVIVSKMTKLREDGVVSIHTKLPKFSQIQDKETPQILDQTGLFYYSLEYEKLYQNILYFNQSQQTGFYQEDFDQIMNLKLGNKYNNSCNIMIQNSVCRKNRDGVEYNFFIKDIQGTNLSILVKIQSQKFKNTLSELFQQFDEFRNQIIQNLYILILSIVVLLCIFLFTSTNYLQKPLDRLLKFSFEYIRDSQLTDYNLEKESIKLQQKYQSQTFIELDRAFFRITSLHLSKGRKNLEKIIIEKFQYPRNIKLDHLLIGEPLPIRFQLISFFKELMKFMKTYTLDII
ncbi:hypothetical protein pb186bvf_014866 [Paramecium bursaria]